jgi:hypothetical protein
MTPLNLQRDAYECVRTTALHVLSWGTPVQRSQQQQRAVDRLNQAYARQ